MIAKILSHLGLPARAPPRSPARHFLVVEVNSSPELEGIERVTGKDIAGRIVEFIEEHAETGKTRTRSKG